MPATAPDHDVFEMLCPLIFHVVTDRLLIAGQWQCSAEEASLVLSDQRFGCRAARRGAVAEKPGDLIDYLLAHQSIRRELAPGNVPPTRLRTRNLVLPRNIRRRTVRVGNQ